VYAIRFDEACGHVAVSEKGTRFGNVKPDSQNEAMIWPEMGHFALPVIHPSDSSKSGMDLRI
jgi:hypothetical protein